MGLNARVNDRDYLVPMVVEEPSVVAAASNAARMIREGGGFEAESDEALENDSFAVVLQYPGANGEVRDWCEWVARYRARGGIVSSSASGSPRCIFCPQAPLASRSRKWRSVVE